MTVVIPFLCLKVTEEAHSVMSLLSLWLCLTSSKVWRKIGKAKKRGSEGGSPASWGPHGGPAVLTTVQVCWSVKCCVLCLTPPSNGLIELEGIAREGVLDMFLWTSNVLCFYLVFCLHWTPPCGLFVFTFCSLKLKIKSTEHARGSLYHTLFSPFPHVSHTFHLSTTLCNYSVVERWIISLIVF